MQRSNGDALSQFFTEPSARAVAGPKALGLAVPGMPIGSPGMDGPAYGGRLDSYQVLLIQKDGSSQVFNSYS